MRDHPAHGAYIMAGMWGARLDDPEVRRRFLVAFKDMFQVWILSCWGKINLPHRRCCQKSDYPINRKDRQTCLARQFYLECVVTSVDDLTEVNGSCLACFLKVWVTQK